MAGAPNGGAELFFERLSGALAANGVPVLPVIRRDHGRAARLSAMGLAPVQLGFGGRLDFLTRPRAAMALRRFEPSVAVAWMGRAARLAPRGDWPLVGRLGGRYDLSSFRNCDHLVGNTAALADWLVAEGFDRDRVHHVPNFSADLAGAAPAALPCPAGAPVVLAMGRLHAAKAFDVLIAALARLPGVHGVIAGEGPLRETLEALAARAGIAGRVHFLGWRNDTAALLAAADVFVCPSRREPLGNVILEAFSAGRPVVASMAEGPAALIEAGRNGVLVPIDSAIALAAGIEGVLADAAMAGRLAAAGRAGWEAVFSEAAVLPRWIELLGSVRPVRGSGV